MANDDLKELYGNIMEKHGKRRDITSSTSDLLAKAHPKSPMVLDYESELFGLSPEDIKRLPIKSVEMLHQAIQHLIAKTKKDPVLRQRLRLMIDEEFDKAEEEVEGEGGDRGAGKGMGRGMREGVEITEELVLESYKNFLNQISESKAQRFNYKLLLDLEPTKINNPFFNQMLQTFQLVDLTRPQKQGVLLLLKKLADIAEGNPQIAQALNRIVRLESQMEQPIEEEPMFRESQDEDEKKNCELIIEGILTTSLTPATLLADLGIAQNKKDEFASSLLGYANWADVEKTFKADPKKFQGNMVASVKNAGGEQKFINQLRATKISNMDINKLAAKFAK